MSTKFGDTIQDYRVLNLLGGGGFGKVYRAIAKNGSEVAIKMISKADIMGTSKKARVKCEVEIHNRLLHPAILDVYSFFEDSTYIYLVLEICHNGSLEEFIKSRKLDESEAREIFHQIVDGLLYLHSHKILHRDLNLSNILVTKDLKIKIADFGLATELKTDQKQFTMCGTPNYMAPEIARRASHGLESDVWSLGCILYTLLVGQPPFQTGTVRNTLHRVVKGSFEVPKELSPAARDLISSLLKTNPRERPKLDEILHHPFMQKSPRSPSSAALPRPVSSGGDVATSAMSSAGQQGGAVRGSLVAAPLKDITDSKVNGRCAVDTDSTGKKLTKVCPLNATRLRAMQHDTCNVLISISALRTVVLKFRHRPASSQNSMSTPHMTRGTISSENDNFKEILEISTNGMEVKVFRPMRSSTSTHKSSTSFEGFYSHATYSYHTLPSRYWKKYNYASSYVDMVRSRTPKVITYSDEAKCMLMENGPNADFEASFYNGTKVRFSGSEISCIEEGGVSYTLKDGEEVPVAVRSYVDHAQKYVQVCRRIETSLDWDSEDVCFPIICKKRPRRFARKPQPSRPSVEAQVSVKVQSSYRDRSGGTSRTSESGKASPSSMKAPTYRTSDPGKAPPVLRRVHVNGIGWAMQLSSGEVELWCNDGSQLKLDPASSLSFLQYKDHRGNIFKYGKKDRDSNEVRMKLDVMTCAVQALSSAAV